MPLLGVRSHFRHRLNLDKARGIHKSTIPYSTGRRWGPLDYSMASGLIRGFRQLLYSIAHADDWSQSRGER